MLGGHQLERDHVRDESIDHVGIEAMAPFSNRSYPPLGRVELKPFSPRDDSAMRLRQPCRYMARHTALFIFLERPALPLVIDEESLHRLADLC